MRAYILEKYCSMNNFCNEIELLPQTMSAIFKRGIKTCSTGNLFKICEKLDISIDSLKDGKIEPRVRNGKQKVNFDHLIEYLDTHCVLESFDRQLTERDLARFYSYLDFACELMRQSKKGFNVYPYMTNVPSYEDEVGNNMSESEFNN